MALSNMLKEPRREITESVVGILLVLMYASVAITIQQLVNPYIKDVAISTVIGIFAPIFGYLILVGIHAIGEAACNALARKGIELRPKQRY